MQGKSRAGRGGQRGGVCGRYLHRGGVPAYGAAQWNGTAWSGLYGGLDAIFVSALAVGLRGQLNAGGFCHRGRRLKSDGLLRGLQRHGPAGYRPGVARCAKSVDTPIPRATDRAQKKRRPTGRRVSKFPGKDKPSGCGFRYAAGFAKDAFIPQILPPPSRPAAFRRPPASRRCARIRAPG